ncbi:glycoside hydrolase [Niastella vici]|uniref:Glycoside hydrolase n=1 Tax=Niastella vici TaxID=1703345 RepID=A0A1V9G735_9BACT|nr:glycoside hydrolase [Niastella vici]OQP66387.1 glycoside hydrolase [Niastella vici]
MKKMRPFILAIPLALLLVQCKKTIKEPTTSGENRTGIPEAFETVIDNTFANYTTFEQYWNYLYPWGSDHNGTARMYGSSTDHNHIYLDASGVLHIKAAYITWNEGNSSSSPYLPIHYHSGAINAKFQVLVNDQFPNYEIRGEFQAPSVKGSWPAFWLTGVNSWPPESDIMEFKGNTNVWQNTFRTSSDVSSIITNVSSPGSWHQYRIWMTKSTATDVTIHYYIDGVWKGQHTGNFVGKPMYIIINMQMEGSSGSPGPTADTYLNVRNVYVGRTRAF